MDRDRAGLAANGGAPIAQSSLFIGGRLDAVTKPVFHRTPVVHRGRNSAAGNASSWRGRLDSVGGLFPRRTVSSVPFPNSPTDYPACVPDEPSAKPSSDTPRPYAPPRIVVPDFPPICAGGRGGGRFGAALRRMRRHLATVLGLLAVLAAVFSTHGTSPRHERAAPRGTPSPPSTVTSSPPGPAEQLVRAPVRIADSEAAALLRPGARVDVLAGARVVASRVTVVAVPPSPAQSRQTASTPPEGAGAGNGALVVLAVSRRTAAALSGAAAASPLGVALC
jgi:hypothetical protein